MSPITRQVIAQSVVDQLNHHGEQPVTKQAIDEIVEVARGFRELGGAGSFYENSASSKKFQESIAFVRRYKFSAYLIGHNTAYEKHLVSIIDGTGNALNLNARGKWASPESVVKGFVSGNPGLTKNATLYLAYLCRDYADPGRLIGFVNSILESESPEWRAEALEHLAESYSRISKKSALETARKLSTASVGDDDIDSRSYFLIHYLRTHRQSLGTFKAITIKEYVLEHTSKPEISRSMLEGIMRSDRLKS